MFESPAVVPPVLPIAEPQGNSRSILSELNLREQLRTTLTDLQGVQWKEPEAHSAALASHILNVLTNTESPASFLDDSRCPGFRQSSSSADNLEVRTYGVSMLVSTTGEVEQIGLLVARTVYPFTPETQIKMYVDINYTRAAVEQSDALHTGWQHRAGASGSISVSDLIPTPVQGIASKKPFIVQVHFHQNQEQARALGLSHLSRHEFSKHMLSLLKVPTV